MKISLLPFLAGAALGQIIDNFATFPDPGFNNRGSWHGCDESGSITCTFARGSLTIRSSDTDLSYYTQFDNYGCQDISGLNNRFLHIAFSGSRQYTIAIQQNDRACGPGVEPNPETWDVVNAADYVDGTGQNIYVPISHFNIIKTRALGLAIKAFREPNNPTTLRLVEIIQTLPAGVQIPAKKPTGVLHFKCTRPNSIAFGIDDGVPGLKDRLMDIITQENIKVTFFAVGQGLDDPSTGFATFYNQAVRNGHQVSTHSYSHPKLESLSVAAIDSEITRGRDSLMRNVGVGTTYFRAPFGTDGALTRQRLEALVPNSKTINWSIDIEDWLWGQSSTPQKQTEAVERFMNAGGNLFVMHFLYPSTVDQFRTWINMARARGLQIMRIDQCMGDPNAPRV